MKSSKASFLIFLCAFSLCLVAVPQVVAQTSTETVYILSDGSIYASENSTVPIQQEGNVYTFTDDLTVYSFVVQCSGVVIDGAGHSIQGDGYYGIDLSSVDDVTIKNVNLLGAFNYGVYLDESYYNTIMDCTVSGNSIGMIIYNCSQNTVTGNSITGNQAGVQLMLTSDNIFRNNNLDNTQNIAIYGTSVSEYVNDIDDSNTIEGNKKIYYLVGEENLVMNSDTYPDVGLLALVSCTNITVSGLELSDNGQGILMVDTVGSVITQNIISENSYGILVVACSSNSITGNTITSNDRGVQLSMGSTANTISANEITYNNGGMFLFDSPQNSIVGNTIQDNSNFGLGLSASSYNMFRANYFIDNGEQVHDVGLTDDDISVSVNTWSVTYPAGGNYWSDYTGTDVKSGSDQDEDGSDGVGDTPYMIYEGAQDEYPLILEGSLMVSITSPLNTTYATTSVTLTATVTDSNAVVGYSLDGQENITLSGSTTLSNLAEGSHEVTVYAKNTEGKESSQTIYFTVSEGGTDTPITNDDETEDLPITLIAAVAAVAVIGIVVLYFLILKKK